MRSTSPEKCLLNRRRRAIALSISTVFHLAIFGGLLLARVPPLPAVEADAIVVSYVDFAAPIPTSAVQPPAAAAKPATPKPPPRAAVAVKAVRPTPESLPAPKIKAIDAAIGAAAEPSAELSDGQLAGAASAESGEEGGGCNMAARVQSALRKDPLVRTALLSSAGRATLVWNGDWVRSGGEEGKGLAAVREAILWEVGFAPPACKTRAMRGLILLSLNGAPGATRLAIGAGEWRWSDLLKPR